jgi:hypothetical protein
MLAQILELLAQGRGIQIFPREVELSTQQAAAMLNVSRPRPYLIGLLEAGKIPFRGEVVSQPLCPGLADVELSADRRAEGTRSAASRPLQQRVRVEPGPGRGVRRDLGTADDHHEQLVRADQRDRWPRGHRRAG